MIIPTAHIIMQATPLPVLGIVEIKGACLNSTSKYKTSVGRRLSFSMELKRIELV